MFYTTPRQIIKSKICNEDLDIILSKFGRIDIDDTISMQEILEKQGIEYAIRSLETIDYCNEIMMFTVRCARIINKLIVDPRSIEAVNVAERYASRKATIFELKNSFDLSWDAVDDAIERLDKCVKESRKNHMTALAYAAKSSWITTVLFSDSASDILELIDGAIYFDCDKDDARTAERILFARKIQTLHFKEIFCKKDTIIKKVLTFLS